ncbi:haloacid dehalogenase-like hydrolase [Streptomyces sp. NPDC005438]|uniref:HAD family hydrolase n=1 Tax=Streptomyces sp. NPDC005438 TaxID=3156880 RepID=UPI0033B493F3
MTLIDSRPGVLATYRALSEETGVWVDAELAVSRLGPPLEEELAHWFPSEAVGEVADHYRRLYPRYAVEPVPALPGAHQALAAVRRAGGRVLVVTAKNRRLAELHLSRLGLEVDGLLGGLWAEAKGDALREEGAAVYVGDHVGDVRGAHRAEAWSVAVSTGPCGPGELREAGAHVVLPDLGEFAGWLAACPQGAQGSRDSGPVGEPARDDLA